MPPAREIARCELVEARSVGCDVWVNPVMFRGQERVRPARRCNDRHTPWAFRENACNSCADIEAAPWVRARRVERVRIGAVGQMRAAAALGDNRGAVAVEGERYD